MHAISYDSIDTSIWTIITETEGSDYSGTSVTRANYEWFVSNHGKSSDLVQVYGWFGGYAVAYRTAAYETETMDETIREAIDSISEYPIICDETLYRVETQWVQDAMDDWTIPDFKRAVERIMDRDDLWDDIDESTVQLIWDECLIRSGEDWIFEHCAAWIDVDRIASQFQGVISSIDDIRAAFKA